MTTEPTPETTVAVILGAQDFTRAGLESDAAFRVSATSFKDYLLRSSGLGLSAENVLDLFDDPHSPDFVDSELHDFLHSTTSRLATVGRRITDVIIYYTGHATFTHPDDEYVLVLRASRKQNLTTSTYRLVSLAVTLRTCTRHARRFLILDCCFAASAYSAFQSGVLDAVNTQFSLAFPGQGTSLLCASAQDRPAKSRLASGATASGMTLFSECLLATLDQGVGSVPRERLSLEDVGLAIEELMAKQFSNEGARPQVKSPDERNGDVAKVPLFPNNAYKRYRPPTKHTILFLAAGPLAIDRLALDSEARAVGAALERGSYRDCFELTTRWAASPLALGRELRELKPTIVHLGGTASHDLISQEADSTPRSPFLVDLPGVIRETSASIKLILLSGCYSESLADEILGLVDCVLGTEVGIHHEAARRFAVGFYGALAERTSIGAAYRQGRIMISLRDLPGRERTKLKLRANIDANQFALDADADGEPPAVRTQLGQRHLHAPSIPSDRAGSSVGNKHTILFLSAQSHSYMRSGLEREARAIEVELERSGQRDCFDFRVKLAVEFEDLFVQLRKLRPAIVHFSVNGNEDGLLLQGGDGEASLVSANAVAEVFATAEVAVKVVILNGCFAETLAEALLAHVDHVVGLGSQVLERSARAFMIGFYGGIAEGESIAAAYKQGRASISLEGLPGDKGVHLKSRLDCDPLRFVLVRHAPSTQPLQSAPKVPMPELGNTGLEATTTMVGNSFLYSTASKEITARKSKAMQLVGEPDASERLIVFAPHGAPYDGLGFAIEQLLEIVETCDSDPALNRAQFRGEQKVLSNGIARTSSGNRFGIGLDGSLAICRRLFHDRSGVGKVVQRGDVGLFSSLEQVFAAILYARRLASLSKKNIYQWSFRHELHGVETRHLMNELISEESASDWPMSNTCAERTVSFAGEIDLRSTDEQIADLLNKGGVNLAAAFGKHKSVAALRPGTTVVASAGRPFETKP